MNIGISVSASVSLPGLVPSPPGVGKGHPFELRAGPYFGGELQVVSLKGRERVNDVYRYEVTFVTDQAPELVTSALFGMPACLSIKSPGHDPRIIQGVASSVEAIGCIPEERGTHRRRFRLEIVPRLWLLRHRRQNRVFQNKSVPDIVDAILGIVGIQPTDCRWRVDRASYPPLPFVYQRGESDYEFFRRVLASAGLFFFFEHPNGLLDSMLGGAASAVAGAVGAAAGMLGGAVGAAVGSVEGALGMVTVLNFGAAPGHTAAVTSALASIVGDAMQEGAGALAGAIGGAVGGAIDAVAGAVEEPSDSLPFDDEQGADADVERVYDFELKKTLRTKELRMLDRNVEAATSWVGVASVAPASLSLDVSAGLSLAGGLSAASSGGGLSAAGGLAAAASIGGSFDVDAPLIPPSMLRQELYQAELSVWQDAAEDKRLSMELARERRRYQEGHGRSDCRRLAAGYRFTLAGHPIHLVNGEYTVTALDVVGVHPDFVDEGQAVYRNRFHCIPAHVAPRPKRPKRRPKPGMEVAKVVGFLGGEALPGLEANEPGYVRVRFRWDILDDDATHNGPLEIGTDDVNAVWIPVMQPWAGAGYGTQFLPREGMEVLVGFMENQSERPVILGCLYSEVNRPPWNEYVDHQKVGIRSQSRPNTTGFSELSIDDRTGGERVKIRAQRDLDVEVLRDATTTLERNASIKVQGGVATAIAGDQTTTIRGTQSTTIGGSTTTTVVGAADARIGSSLDVSVAGDETRSISGAQITTVGGVSGLAVQGSQKVSVGDDAITVVGRRHAMTVGTGSDASAESDTYVWGKCRVGSKDILTLESTTAVVLRCGETELRLTPKSLEMIGHAISGTASKGIQLSGNGPSMHLGDDLQVTSKQMAFQSESARLSLSDKAQMVSSQVQLGKPSDDKPAPSSDTKTPPTPTTITVLGPDHLPLTNKTYQLEIGGTTTEGTTDGSGAISATLPDGVTTGRCTVWQDEFPQGSRVTFHLTFEALPPATDLGGAQRRLRNLGYYGGDPTAAMDGPTRDALLVFQYAQGLELTGLLDETTSAKLAEVHP